MAWKSLCEKHAYRRLSDVHDSTFRPTASSASLTPGGSPQQSHAWRHPLRPSKGLISGLAGTDLRTQSLDRAGTSSSRSTSRKNKAMTYRSHFKQRYMVETAWRSGGRCDSRQITPDQGVVTSLHLTDKNIVVALDNAKIHVFDTQGQHQKTLQGHVMGVWAMVPWGDLLVSGGCDRDVRVWNMATG